MTEYDRRSLRTGFTAVIALLLVTTPVAGAASVGGAGAVSEAERSLDRTPGATDGDVASRAGSAAGIDARILNYYQDTGSYEEDEEVTADVEVRNTGDRRHTFFVGYGVQGPDDEWYNNDEGTGTTVTLDPNEREWVTVSWRVEDDAPTGAYDSRVAVWQESDRNNLNTRLADERYLSAFEVIESTNEPPTADIQCTDSEVEVGETVTCAADRSTDDGTITSYRWDFGGRASESGDVASHAFSRSGDYTVEVTVTDDDGATDTAWMTISVEDVEEPPSADVSCTPTDATVDDVVECSAADSYDRDDTLRSFEWDFGDGESGDGEWVTHRFDGPGSYTVRLQVTDDDGLTDTASETVRIEDVEEPPSADVSCTPTDVTVGETVECSASGSYDEDGSVSAFDWQFGDGITDGGEYVTHTFDEAGTYTVELDVTDDDGLTASATEEVTVIEDNEEPAARISYSPSHLERGDTVRLDASGSTDPDGEVDEYEWTLGGDRKYGETVEYTLDDTGDHTVELAVTDDDGATDTATQSLSVRGRPTAAFDFSPEQPNSGHSVSFEAERDSRVERYEWDFDGDGEYEARGRKATHRFDSPGKSSVELRVVDRDGMENSASEIVTVQQNAYFQLTADRATVEGSSGTTVVQFSASNHVNDERLQVKLELDLPDESVSIESVAGESPASRKSTGFFEVGPGEDKSFRVRLRVNEPGTYDVGGKAVYYYGDQEDRRDRDVGPITVGTEAEVADAQAQDGDDENRDGSDDGNRDATEAGLQDAAETRTDDTAPDVDGAPGFGPAATVAGLVVAVWLARKRR